MSEKSATTYTVLHLRFKLRVPPDVLLAQSREAATIIASVEGLIWKIWVLQEQEFEMGGMYLFASRETAEAYLNHPVVQAVCLCCRQSMVLVCENRNLGLRITSHRRTGCPMPQYPVRSVLC